MLSLKLILLLAGHSCSTSECESFSFPYHLGNLGIVNPTIIVDSQYDASTKITNPLKDLIIQRFMTSQLLMSVLFKTEFIWIGEWLINNNLVSFILPFHHLFNRPWIWTVKLVLPLH